MYDLNEALRVYGITDRRWLRGFPGDENAAVSTIPAGDDAASSTSPAGDDAAAECSTGRTSDAASLLAEAVRAAIRGGCSMIQLREKHLSRDAFAREARDILAVCREAAVPLIINDCVDIAVQTGADGVHVGQSDLAVERARAMLGPEKIIGATAHTVEEALAAEAAGADYLGVGAVFPTESKADTTPLTLEALAEICRTVRIPVVAIGGVTKDNLPALEGSGIAGVAVIGAIFAQADVEKAARDLSEAVKMLGRDRHR